MHLCAQRLRLFFLSIYNSSMNRRLALLNLSALLSLFLATSGCETGEKKFGPLTVRSGSQALESGMAEIEITPHVGFRMAGYFDERFSTGTHDPLKAKALVFRQGKELAALVFCDIVGLPLNATAKARAQASAE